MPLPQISTFSTGYYLLEEARLVETDDVPVLNDHCYAFIQDTIYGSEPTPILLRYPSANFYFSVMPSDDIDGDQVGLPGELLDAIDVDLPAVENFLIARPKRARQLHRLQNAREQLFV